MNQSTLVEFESARKNNNYNLIEGSNTFFTIGDGVINVLTIRADNDDTRLDLSTDKGTIESGGSFEISGDIQDSSKPYRNFVVIANTKFIVTHPGTSNNHNDYSTLTISKGKFEVHGEFELAPNTQLFVRNKAQVILYTDSIFKINDKTNIFVEKGSSVTIYGQVDVHLSTVDSILNADGVTIDSAAVMNVEGIDKSGRAYSVSDYESDLRERIINIHTQGETNSSYGRLGYTWTGGSPTNFSQIIMMSVLYGEAILGDFKLSALGLPETDIANLQMISDIHVCKDTTLYIQEEYKGGKYIRPELYLGIVINNNSRPANLIIDGNVVCDGSNSMITVDRGSAVYINKTGTLTLSNNAIMRSTHNDEHEHILFIDGTLIIDSTSQIDTFTKNNIVFGETGKVVIRNPDTGEKRILFTTPNGIFDTTLYKLFEDIIDHIEYHVSNNTGIVIDQYFEFYSRDMTKWFGDRRIEKAIYDGILVWHDGGFIELHNDITPWADENSTLLHASRLFKTYGSYDDEKLQEAVDRLRYAGSGNILFRFIRGDKCKEVLLDLTEVNMESVINYPMTTMYNLKTDNSGELFLRNRLSQADADHIVNSESRMLSIEENEIDFPLG